MYWIIIFCFYHVLCFLLVIICCDIQPECLHGFQNGSNVQTKRRSQETGFGSSHADGPASALCTLSPRRTSQSCANIHSDICAPEIGMNKQKRHQIERQGDGFTFPNSIIGGQSESESGSMWKLDLVVLPAGFYYGNLASYTGNEIKKRNNDFQSTINHSVAQFSVQQHSGWFDTGTVVKCFFKSNNIT